MVMNDLTYEKGFDRNAFISYLYDNFDMYNCFAEDIINNIIDYAHKYEHVSKDQFAYFIADMIPAIEFDEVAAFCEDCCLTNDGIRKKHNFWNESES